MTMKSENKMVKAILAILISATFLAYCLSFVACSQVSRDIPAVDELRTLGHGGINRTYLLHVPSGLHEGKSAPLVFVFHGGGGDGMSMARLTGFDKLADREGFIAVFPDGVSHNWNDGRQNMDSEAHQLNIDDIGFVDTLIETIAREFPVDRKRIYATGISNGAIFSHFLSAQMSSKIAAISPVVGGIPVPFNEHFNPDNPVSVLIIQGTEDPLVPYDGGQIANGNRGEIISTDDAVELWVQYNACRTVPLKKNLPNNDLNDGCVEVQYTWSGGRANSEVVLIKIDGGGHTWPGGAQYLPKLVIGRVCNDFEATEIIWSFFKLHPKP